VYGSPAPPFPVNVKTGEGPPTHALLPVRVIVAWPFTSVKKEKRKIAAIEKNNRTGNSIAMPVEQRRWLWLWNSAVRFMKCKH
jgi:hypothetical protein